MYGRSSLLLLVFIGLSSFYAGYPVELSRYPVELSGYPVGSPGDPIDSARGIRKIYDKADRLFHRQHSTAASDSLALAGFGWVIDKILQESRSGRQPPGQAGEDTLLFQSYLKKGILLDAKYDFGGAKEAYTSALNLHKEEDSLAFVVYVYTGAGYYNLNIFDSANYFLLKAESLADRFRDPEDKVRLYNTLGVLYHDNGNYQQGKNYFSQALEIVKNRQPFDAASAVSLETNIATCFYRLGSFQESLSLYQRILSYHLFTSPIYMNMGMAYRSLEKYPEAMACFRKVDAAALPGVCNEMGYAALQLNRIDSAGWWLNQFSKRFQTGKSFNELDLGINHLYRADLFAAQEQYKEALRYLQKAIVLFSPNFNKEDLFSNPADFRGTFACYRLFDALSKKASFLERLYRSRPEGDYLKASYATYKAAISLLAYIEKSYDTDDAKIFLKKRNKEVYQGALTACLELYRLFPRDHYLEQAFLISDENKASIIGASLGERNLDRIPGPEKEILQQERNIKYNIARLNAKREMTKDPREIEKMAAEKEGYEIGLSRIQKKLEQNSQWYRQKYEDTPPSIAELQRRLSGKQALISFYLTKDALHLFTLTKSSLAYTRIDSAALLERDVKAWLDLLKVTESGKRFRGEAIGSRLYKALIKPMREAAAGKEEWILIPDGFLYFLPFESLSEGGGSGTLLETTTVSYQWSSRFLLRPGMSGTEPVPDGAAAEQTVLAFAPFAIRGGHAGGEADGGREKTEGRDPAGEKPENGGTGGGLQSGGAAGEAAGRWFKPLRGSREEIAGLPGVQYIDSLATKDRFLREINLYPIVHLATHAVSSVNTASASFIAFYPQKKSALDDCLFLEELYGLDMSKTRLVVISACETGQGELVSNEGVISLARAFAYAGCESTISSLWKADDQATSFILRRFYVHLQDGNSRAKALRQAKLDYLHSDVINKGPGFWSHLILIGDAGPVYPARHPWALFLFPGGLVVIYLLLLYCTIRRSRVDIRTTTS